MARFNELLGGAANYSRALALALGLEEQEGVTTVAPEIVPTFNLWERPELWYLFRGTPFAARQILGVTAAQFSTIFLRNPAGSNLLAIVDQLIFNTSATTYRVGIDRTSALASDGAFSVIPSDTRLPLESLAVAMHTRVQAADPQPTRLVVQTAGQLYVIPVRVILRPGSDLLVTPTVVNTGLDVAMSGYIRPALPRELESI